MNSNECGYNVQRNKYVLWDTKGICLHRYSLFITIRIVLSPNTKPLPYYQTLEVVLSIPAPWTSIHELC